MSAGSRSRFDTTTRPGAEPPEPTADLCSRLIGGGALETLRRLPEHCAQVVVTSPPYWGLRDYGVEPTIWGGEAGCRHSWRDELGGSLCERCRAWAGCLGLEGTPDLYVSHLVAVMREVRRCLRPDGTLWLVLGDSFATHAKGNPGDSGRIGGPRVRSQERRGAYGKASAADLAAVGLKDKDLIGIPWRVALALQADGWWLRSDNIWHKPNVMPEPVRDRPTRAHEYAFLLSPSSRYFYDWFAVREPDSGRRSGNGFVRPERLSYGPPDSPRGQGAEWVGGGGRNRRTVWTIASQRFRGAHYATFPETLAEVCLLAGTSPVSCRRCGAPWRRVVESTRLLDGEREVHGGRTEEDRQEAAGRSMATGHGARRVEISRTTTAWESGCRHDEPGGRCLVLDPFAGAATTGLVAARHGRDWLGIELSGEYAGMAGGRLREAGVPVRLEGQAA